MKHSAGTLGAASYDVVSEAYADAISVMIYKNNRLAKLFRCQLLPQPGGVLSDDLILPYITPQPLLGSAQEDAAGQLYASVVASLISRQSPDDTRSVVVGFGPVGPGETIEPQDREELLLVTKLVEEARVW